MLTTMRVSGWLRNLSRAGVDFLYPPVCPFCREEVDPEVARSSGGFCAACRVVLSQRIGGICQRCGGSIGPYLDPTAGCGYCRDEKFAFERVIRLGIYDEALRVACLRGKHAGSEPLLAGLAHLLWELEANSFRDSAIDLVVPVPQHWVHRLWRPHDTTEAIGAVWSNRLNRPLARHILKKTRLTPSQARLGPHERRHNLRNAFAARKSVALEGASVLLVDDVMTTGATANEASKVLKRSGAKRIVVAVLARGLGQRS